METVLPQRSRLGVVPFLGLTAATAALGARSTRGGQGLRYRRLKKPPFQPPPWVFGPVWTALYGLMSVSAYTAVSRRIDRPAAWMMAPYLGWLGFAGALNAEIVRRND